MINFHLRKQMLDLDEPKGKTLVIFLNEFFLFFDTPHTDTETNNELPLLTVMSVSL